MLKKIEFNGYKSIVESDETQVVLGSNNPDSISKLGGEMAVYYARLSGELAEIKDEIMREVYNLSQTLDQKGKPMAMGRAEMLGEINVNNRNEVTRREIEYLMEAFDKIGFACSARCRSLNKEGNF